MAKYTVELGDLHESGFKVFDFPYSFYDPSKKAEFEQLFIDYFYYREIGVETPARFRHNLKVKCHTVLPLYNEMLKIAQMEYDLVDNYKLVETFEKTNTATKGTTGNTSNTLNRTSDVLDTGAKTNTLNSTTDHTENIEFIRDEKLDETSELDKTSTMEVDNTKVNSKTPSGLLEMVDIKTNAYASEADREDNTSKAIDDQTTKASKTDNITEDTTRSTKDVVSATNTDSTTETRDETTHETNIGNITQNENANGSENYTLIRTGNIGVDTQSDMLRKHIEFQKTVKNAYLQFFDQCENLFMQIY